MAKGYKHFSDVNGETIELTRLTYMSKPEFAKTFPGVKGKSADGYSMWVGEPVDYVQTFDREVGKWRHDYRPVTRTIAYKANPSLHECDARCMNATGRTMNCECKCGGKNHGKAAAFTCEVAA
jgi:hypothetical protein